LNCACFAADHVGRRRFGIGAVADRGAVDVERDERDQVREDPRLGSKLLEDREGQRGVVESCLRGLRRLIGGVKEHEPVGIGDRQPPQHNRVHHTEHRRVGADAKRQREDRHDGEDGRAAELPEREAKVLHHGAALDGAAP